MRSVLLAVALVAGIVFTARPALHAVATVVGGSPCADAAPVPPELTLPAVVPPGEPVEVERQLLEYLRSYKYRELGWCHDKGVRDTGPYLDGVSYGVHPAVQIWYSPEMIEWLRGGRKGVPKDGAVMIKEQYGNKPAVFFKGRPEADLQPTDWTIMIRRTGASHDGWFWGEVYVGMFAAPIAKTAYPNAGFGLYCLRCHGSAERAMTFATLENVAGFPGTPIAYKVDNSWMHPAVAPPTPPAVAAKNAATPTPRPPLAVQTFPPEPLDTFVAHAHVPHMFLTSDQCMGCHSSAPGKPFGPVMSVSAKPGRGGPLNVSEYGEWRWSPMALAGRDPVFFAQFESELAYLRTIRDPKASATLQKQVTGICMTCHAAMGQRQLKLDHPGRTFEPAMVFDAQPSHADFHYGGLARDGISCSLCHHAAETVTPKGSAPLAYFLDHKINGTFDTGPPDKLYGPFKDLGLVTHPMNEALGAKPRFNAYVQNPRLCGSCHTINLPVVDKPPVGDVAMQSHNVEQATYLEWLNSSFQTEYGPGPRARSCQSCHMPEGVTDDARGIALSHIASKIALVQDDSYPETSNIAPAKDLRVQVRKTGFRRHELLGLNAFLLTLFKQYPEVMGVRTSDYMSGSATDLQDAIAHVVRQAQKQTATLSIVKRSSGRTEIADVEVVNLTGHKFPSGVAFRRAFLEVAFYDKRRPGAAPFFVSGRTDDRGRILGAAGTPLPSETFARDARGRQQYQEHFDEAHPIRSEDQVQIFEELTRDRTQNFTFSFIRRDHEVKDNRIEPLGFTLSGPTSTMPAYFLHATYPKGRAASDPRYLDGKGHAIVRYAVAVPAGIPAADVGVRATLCYESWEPAFLAMRASGKDLAARRFAALVGGVDLRGTALENWKLRIATAQR